MGADIHVFIEQSDFNNPDGSPYWSPFGGEVRLDRQYSLFGRIANVRQGGALFEPRGLPDKLAYAAEDASRLRIVEDGHADAEDEGVTTRSRAEQWVKHGEKIIKVGSSEYVTHPDWHSHTWFTPAEWRQILQAQEEDAVRSPAQVSIPGRSYYAVAAALEALEGEPGTAAQARLIVWFDN